MRLIKELVRMIKSYFERERKVKYCTAVAINIDLEHAERKENFQFFKDHIEFKSYSGQGMRDVFNKAREYHYRKLLRNTQVDLNTLVSAYVTCTSWVTMYHQDKTEYDRQANIRACTDLKRPSRFLLEFLLLQAKKTNTKFVDKSECFEESQFYKTQITADLAFVNFMQSNQFFFLPEGAMTLEIIDREEFHFKSELIESEKELFEEFDRKRIAYIQKENKRFRVLNKFSYKDIEANGVSFIQKFDEIFTSFFSFDEIRKIVGELAEYAGANLVMMDSDTLKKEISKKTGVSLDRVANVIELFTLDSDKLVDVPKVSGDNNFDEIIHLLNENKQERISYCPIIKFEGSDGYLYLYTASLLAESYGLFLRNILFTQINDELLGASFRSQMAQLKNWCTVEWFENAVAEEIRSELSEIFEVHKESDLFGISTKNSGDYDVLLISKDGKTVVVLDCKLIGAKYMAKGFKSDVDIFSTASKYVRKINDKVKNIEDNLSFFKKGVMEKYNVEVSESVKVDKYFISAYPTMADLRNPPCRIIPAKDVVDFLRQRYK